MKTVLFRGPMLTQSGYGVHARQISKWLLSRKDISTKFVPVPWGTTPWLIDSRLQGGEIGEIMSRTVNADHKADVSVQLQLPNEWNPTLAPVNIGVTAAVETDRCNPDWVAACNKMSAVVVPSQHAKACLTNTGTVTCPVFVVPESYGEAFATEDVARLPSFTTPFNFLVFGQMTSVSAEADRKNIFHTVKWLCDVFKNDPEVGIIIKTNMGKYTRIDRRATMNVVSALVRDSRKGSPFPKVHLMHGDMDDATVAGLYRHPQVKALVSLTRGEGYGLPILEAAASGLPIIATNWSGHLDFLKNGKFINVYYQLTQVPASRVDGRIFVKGARWATPSEEDFKKKVLKFRNNNSIPLQWASELRNAIVERYSDTKVRSLYDDALKEFI